MAVRDLRGALLNEMREMLGAEKQIARALKKMARKAAHDDLRRGFEEHLEETKGQIERLEGAFTAIDQKPRTKRCDGMIGILEEGEQVIDEAGPPAVMDTMLVSAAQKVEYYEIASYGTLCNWAKVLGLGDVEKLFRQTLNEEKKTNTKLSKLATRLNKQASGPKTQASKQGKRGRRK